MATSAIVNNTSADKYVCGAFNSTLPVYIDNCTKKGLCDMTSQFTLNPYAKCYSPISKENIENNDVCVEESLISCNQAHNETSINVNNGDVYSMINKVKIENANRIIIAHLNINSIRNKIDMLSDIVKYKIDILCI